MEYWATLKSLVAHNFNLSTWRQRWVICELGPRGRDWMEAEEEQGRSRRGKAGVLY